jgi:tRNA (guanine37-N1)-methyltransferase
MTIQIITLFPEVFSPFFETGMMRKAAEIGAAQFETTDLRDYGIGPRRTVDDTPYGGGDGMVLRIEPLFAAVSAAKTKSPQARVLLLTPRGERLTQLVAQSFADAQHDLIMVCGRYEGFDERITALVDQEISIGDYVLTNGEIPAMVITDAVVRLLPDVLGGETSAEKESFSDGQTLEHPHYTRPEEFEGMRVPEVLLSGNHQAIEEWRRENSKSTD